MTALTFSDITQIAVGSHLVQLYENGAQFLDLSARFCAAGLKEGECCIWVTAPPWSATLALLEIARHQPAVHRYVDTGQLRFIPYEEWMSGGEADVPTILAQVRRRMHDTKNGGWPRVRTCGNALQPLSAAEWRKRLQYEEGLHQLITADAVTALCSYRLGSLPVPLHEELVRSHHASIRHGNEDRH